MKPLKIAKCDRRDKRGIRNKYSERKAKQGKDGRPFYSYLRNKD